MTVESVRAKVHVYLKPGVLDPQGKAIMNAISDLGYKDLLDIRQGKYFELTLSPLANKDTVKSICENLLSNPVIENYTVDIER